MDDEAVKHAIALGEKDARVINLIHNKANSRSGRKR